jgi:hypothetical protein
LEDFCATCGHSRFALALTFALALALALAFALALALAFALAFALPLACVDAEVAQAGKTIVAGGVRVAGATLSAGFWRRRLVRARRWAASQGGKDRCRECDASQHVSPDVEDRVLEVLCVRMMIRRL